MRSFCSPGKSTNCTVAYVIFLGLYSFASSTSRGSGTFATPTCVDCPLFASTFAFVKIRNSVVFPTCGSPIIPVCIELEFLHSLRSCRKAFRTALARHCSLFPSPPKRRILPHPHPCHSGVLSCRPDIP